MTTSTTSTSEGSAAKEFFRTTLFPLFLILVCPPTVIIFWATAVHLDGALSRLLDPSGWAIIAAHWPRPTGAAFAIIGWFALLSAVLMVALPGKTHYGPITPAGNRPSYKLNGVLAFLLTHGILWGAGFGLGWFSPARIYDHLGSILMTLSVVAFLFCILLYLKGVYAPSSTDAGRSGNLIWDFYWGVELHPQLGSFNLKQYANCRLGMMGWSVLLVAYAAKQAELYGHVSNSMLVSVLLQELYILKFFIWESGYFGSLDIMHDRFGFYICWGVLVWVPGIYTLTSMSLVIHPVELPTALAVFFGVLGAAAIWGNYDADAQRQRVRQTEGNTTVWGKAPETLRAQYTTSDGKNHESLLLLSGWWGLARHVHYVTEITLALAWALPALFTHLLPYFYVIFLSILLFDRSGRDELRCRKKYGAYWDQYCTRVPYRIIPYLY